MQKPSLGRIVLVRTPEPINGQDESAAIITQVVSGDAVNVMVMPGAGTPFTVGTVYPAGHPYAATHSWRWPGAGLTP